LAIFALAASVTAISARAADSVVVASKIDTEGAVLGNLIARRLQQQGIAVVNKLQLGPTQIVRRAILAGEIDIYPEYTGNGAIFFRLESDPVWRDAAKGYDAVRKLDRERNDLIWLAPAPVNNTWAIAVRKDLAESARLATLGDFGRYVAAGGNVRLAASAEFVNNPGGLPSFQSIYGFALSRRQLLTLAGGNTAATERAAAENISGVNAAMAYGTDGALSMLGLIALADDKGAQIVYAPAPVVRGATLQRHPEIATALDPVFASLTLQNLQAMNAAIAVDGIDATSVADRYLREAGFVPK
jgi:osmoprotectant transport system substrate-binding protein